MTHRTRHDAVTDGGTRHDRSDGDRRCATPATPEAPDPEPPAPEEPAIEPPAPPLLLFTASSLPVGDELPGARLWASDGTAEGTLALAPAGGLRAEPTPIGGGRAIFAGGPSRDVEPWITDGTPEGTALLRDIWPGVRTDPVAPLTFSFLALDDGSVLFRADDGERGMEPWISDGTPEGTVPLADIAPGPAGSDPELLLALPGSRALFTADAGDGPGFWTTDGTAQGTSPLGVAQDDRVSRTPIIFGDGLALFPGRDGAGAEPWVTDGTPEGTRRLRDISPDGDTALVDRAALDDGRAMFVAQDAAGRTDVWITDGTGEGTRPLTEGVPGVSFATLEPLGDGRAAFLSIGPLSTVAVWLTDGTPEGTAPLPLDATPGLPPFLRSLGDGRLLFGASDAAHGWEPWVTDGTPGGTRVLDLTPGPDGTLGFFIPSAPLGDGRVVFAGAGAVRVTDGTEEGSQILVQGISPPYSPGQKIVPPFAFVPLEDGRIAFTARHPELGNEAWITDGTPEGTRLVVDLTPGNSGSDPTPPEPLGDGRAIFGAADQSGYSPGTSREVFVTDGTAGGTRILPSFTGLSAQPGGFEALGDGRALYAATYSPSGGASFSNRAYDELWVSDGTREGTRLVADIEPGSAGSRPEGILSLGGGRAVFGAETSGAGREPWVTDATAEGTRLLADIAPGAAGSGAAGFTRLGGQAVFAAFSPDTGTEAWITDGTPDGTRLLADLDPGPASGDPAGFAPLREGWLVFAASDGAAGREPWVTDGTAEGTRRLADLAPGAAGSAPGLFTALGDGRAVFRAADEDGPALFVTDGTEAGTARLLSLQIGAIGAAGEGRALLAVEQAGPGAELWITDGTAEGTRRLAGFDPAEGEGGPADFLPLGDGRVLFTAADAAHGREPWLTDGTEAGTALLGDIRPGPRGSEPRALALLEEGLAILVANDGIHGAEPWISTGTAEGTRLLADLVTLPESSNPRDYVLLLPPAVPGGSDLLG